MEESVTARVVGECMKQGVIIGKTTRSFRELNNTLCLSPALVCTKSDIDEIINALDNSFKTVCA